jgi:uncharacterized protein (TIGR02246 family)
VAEIEAVNAKWIDFFNKGDFAGVASLYTEDATAFPPGSGMVKGRAAIEALWKSMAEQVSDPKLTTLGASTATASSAQPQRGAHLPTHEERRMTKNETKGNGPQLPVPQSKAGDELRAHALSLVDQAKAIVRATREQCDSLEQAAEELEQQTIERFELLATAAELQIDKTKAAIGTIRELTAMIQDVSKRPSPPANPQGVKAVEEVLTQLEAGKAADE